MDKGSALTIGLAPLARTTFDTQLAQALTDQVRGVLQSSGFTIIGPEKFVSDLEEAAVAASLMQKSPVDLLLVLQATFADNTLAVHLAENIQAPVLIWALPEARTGDRLRLNSFCGLNLAAHGLKRRHIDYDYLYAEPEAPEALEKIGIMARAGKALRLLDGARIGRVGEHPDGFDSCAFRPEALKSVFGVEIVQIELERVFDLARQADPKEVDDTLDDLNRRLSNLHTLDQKPVRGTLAVYLALKKIAVEEGLAGMGVRCWPQFFTELGCAACGAMSMLSDRLIPCSCENDINGAVTQLILQALGDAPAFGTDLVSMDTTEDQVVLWHCGLAPLTMADPEFSPRATIHSNRRLPLLMEFPLKPGPVTVARLSEAQGDFRLVIGGGEMLRAPMSFSGTSGVMRFDRPAGQVLDTLITEGLEHHVSIAYGNFQRELAVLARRTGLPGLNL